MVGLGATVSLQGPRYYGWPGSEFAFRAESNRRDARWKLGMDGFFGYTAILQPVTRVKRLND
jgi:hypothetical protein